MTVISSMHESIPGIQPRNMKAGNIFHCGNKLTDQDLDIPKWIRPILGDQFIWFMCSGHEKKQFCHKPVWESLKINEQYKIFSNCK